jgi:hypothetical protein
MQLTANVFVLGLDELNRQTLEALPRAAELVLHPRLTIEELQHGDAIPLRDLIAKAEQQLASFEGSIDAIVGYWDFPVSSMVPILCERVGLPSASLASRLKCEHKYWSRLEQQKVIPDQVPRFAAFNPFAERPREQIDLDYPFWVKPVKAHSSFLGFRIDSDADFAPAIEEICDKIRCVALPFNEILDRADLPDEIVHEQAVHTVQASPDQQESSGQTARIVTGRRPCRDLAEELRRAVDPAVLPRHLDGRTTPPADDGVSERLHARVSPRGCRGANAVDPVSRRRWTGTSPAGGDGPCRPFVRS